LILFVILPVFLQAQDDTVISRIDLNLRNNNKYDSTFFNIFPKRFNNKKIALVLSGGGARGMAQIGVLDVFEKYDIDFDLIVGTSIGAITGSLYASGYTPEELTRISKSIDWKNKLSLTNKYQREFLFVDQKKVQDKGFISLSFDGFKPALPTSLSSGQQIAELFNLYLLNARYKPNNDFLSLKIPFCAVATDLDKGERVVLKDGNLSESIKASFTFPLLYSPTKVKGRNLVDGGLTANIPVDVAKGFGADLVVTVNSTSPLKSSEELKDPLNTADQVLSITLAQLNAEQLKKSDFVITPDIENATSTDFNNIDYLILKGKDATELMIKDIIGKIDTLEAMSSSNFNNFLFNGSVSFNSDLIPDSLKRLIVNEQSNNFVRYVTIEKRLKDIYRTGYFKNVWAEVYLENSKTRINYQSEQYKRLNGILISFNYGDDIRLYEYKVKRTDSINTGTFAFTQISDKNKVNPEIAGTIMECVSKFGSKEISLTCNNRKLMELHENLLGALRDKDYSLIDISKFYLNENTGVLEISFTDGNVKSINIIGNNITKSSLILGETDIPITQPVKLNNFKESLGGIFGTNLFQQASMSVRYVNKRPELDIYLVEKSARNLYFSFRADEERKLQGYLSLRNENLYGTGNEIGLILKGGLRDREYKFEVKSNKLFNTPLTYNLSAYYKFQDHYNYYEIQNEDDLSYKRQQAGEFRDVRLGASFLVGTQVEKFGTLFSQITYESIRRNQLQGVIPESNDIKLFRIKFGGKIDTEDKSPFANTGTVVNYNYETSRSQLSGGVTYTKFSFDLSHSVLLAKSHVLKPKFIFGFGDKTTPESELFSLGGENSFYGMAEDQLRGRQILLASIEYRYQLPVPIFFDTYLSFRYDLGRIWENSQDIRFKDLRHGIGLSSMFDTPVGKASFSFGRSFYFNKGFSTGSIIWGQYTFYFSIGYDI
jgi:NTE family protein